MALTHEDEREAIQRQYVDTLTGRIRRVQHRAPRARARRHLALDQEPRARRRARRARARAQARRHQRGHHGEQARRGAAAPERIALPRPARVVVRLVLGAGRAIALHRSLRHGPAARSAWRRGVPGPDGIRPRAIAGRGRGSRALQDADRGAQAVSRPVPYRPRRRRRMALHQLLGRTGVRPRRAVRRLSRDRARRHAIAARRRENPAARPFRRADRAAEPDHVHAYAAARVQPRAAAGQAVRAVLHRPRPLQEHQRQPGPRSRATSCCRTSRAGCAIICAKAIPSRAWAATNSSCWSRIAPIRAN